MKMRAVETTNPSIGPWTYPTVETPRDPSLHGKRPLETEADLIAAAAPQGRITARWFCELISDSLPDAFHEGVCELCSTDSGTFASFWKDWAAAVEGEMEHYGVEWDPTIRL